MNLDEYLFTCLQEESSEIIKDSCKVNRFGLYDFDPNDPQCVPNALKVSQEITDLIAVAELLHERGLIPAFGSSEDIQEKKNKVLKYIEYSKNLGNLQ